MGALKVAGDQILQGQTDMTCAGGKTEAVCGQPHAFQCVGRQRCAVLTGPLHHLLGKARGQPLGGRWLDGSDHADGPDPSMI